MSQDSNSEVRNNFNKHLLHPWANLPELGGDESSSIIGKAEGIYIWDEEGNKLIDGPAGMWCMQTGYGRQEIADAVSKQIMAIGYASSFFNINHKEVELAKRIAQHTPGDLNRIFFTTGGSTAVDSALRLAQMYNNIKGRPNKKHILARDKGYHGSTFLSASVTGKERDKSCLDTHRDQVHFLTAPSKFHYGKGMTEEQFCDYLIDELAQKIKEVGAENIMCFIAEPVLASGGVIVPPKDYNKRCYDLIKENDILYIADEVVTAFGRLGYWFASEEVFGITPDIITFAKGLTSGYVPMGGYAVSDALMLEISGDNAQGNIYSNGYTWSGTPVGCAAALESMNIIERENILDNVQDVGAYFQQQMQTLNDHELVGEVRGIGLMAAVELTITADSEEELLEKDYAIGEIVDKHCHKYGLLIRPFINICIMSPPLIITHAQVDDMVDAMRKGLADTLYELKEIGLIESAA